MTTKAKIKVNHIKMTNKISDKDRTKIKVIIDKSSNVKYEGGNTFLMKLCIFKDDTGLRILEIFLKEYECDINEKNNSGKTALDILITSNHPNSYKKLKLILNNVNFTTDEYNKILCSIISVSHEYAPKMFNMVLNHSKTNPIDDEGEYLLSVLCDDSREISITYIEILMSKDFVDVNSDNNDDEPIFRICSSEDKVCVEKLKLFLARSDLDLNREYSAITAICNNTSKYAPKMLDLLLVDSRIDINVKNNGFFPLGLLCDNESSYSFSMLKKFLQRKDILINNQDDLGRNCLCLCVHSNQMDKLNFLLNFPNLDINNKDNKGRTLLMYMALSGRISSLSKVLDYPGIDVNIVDIFNRTFVHHLYEYGNYYNISSISGINVNIQDTSGMTVFMRGCLTCNDYMFDMIYFITNYPKIDVNLCDISGYSGLHAICGVDNETFEDKSMLNDTLKYLLQYTNVDVNAKTSNGDNPLHIICSNISDVSIDLLETMILFSSVDINDKNEKGQTVLHKLGELIQLDDSVMSFEKMRMLICANADPNIPNNDGDTVLHILCRCENEVSFQAIRYLLLNCRCNINYQNNIGDTILHSLCSNDSYFSGVLIDILLDYGADPNILNNIGNSPTYVLEESERFNERMMSYYQ